MGVTPHMLWVLRNWGDWWQLSGLGGSCSLRTLLQACTLSAGQYSTGCVTCVTSTRSYTACLAGCKPSFTMTMTPKPYRTMQQELLPYKITEDDTREPDFEVQTRAANQTPKHNVKQDVTACRLSAPNKQACSAATPTSPNRRSTLITLCA